MYLLRMTDAITRKLTMQNFREFYSQCACIFLSFLFSLIEIYNYKTKVVWDHRLGIFQKFAKFFLNVLF